MSTDRPRSSDEDTVRHGASPRSLPLSQVSSAPGASNTSWADEDSALLVRESGGCSKESALLGVESVAPTGGLPTTVLSVPEVASLGEEFSTENGASESCRQVALTHQRQQSLGTARDELCPRCGRSGCRMWLRDSDGNFVATGLSLETAQAALRYATKIQCRNECRNPMRGFV